MNFYSVTLGIERASILVSTIIGYIGIAIVLYGAVKNAQDFYRSSVQKKNRLPNIRLDMGKHLALGLEFLVAKDIIESIIRPTWDDLGKLAILIALRTFVTWFLSWELKDIKEEIDEEAIHRKALKFLKKAKRAKVRSKRK